MDSVGEFENSVKVGDLVSVRSTQKYVPLQRRGTNWIRSTGAAVRVKRGEALIVVVDKATSVFDGDSDPVEPDGTDNDDINVVQLIVFASGSGCYFGLPRWGVGRY